MSWVPVPNSHDGDGYTLLLEHKNGPALFGAWNAILQIASKCDVRGTLVRGNGKPHDSESISRLTRFPKKIVEEALLLLSDDEIGWLEVVNKEQLTQIPQDGAVIPQDGAVKSHPTDYGREGKGRKGYCSDFEKAWKLYPDKSGKQKAKHAYIAARNEGTTHDAIVDGINRYIAYVEHIRKNGFKDRRWQNGSTWFNGREWESEWTIEEISNGPSQEELNY